MERSLEKMKRLPHQWWVVLHSNIVVPKWCFRIVAKFHRISTLIVGVPYRGCSFLVQPQPFMLTPQTQAQYGKINEEFDQMLHRNQILLPVSSTSTTLYTHGTCLVDVTIMYSRSCNLKCMNQHMHACNPFEDLNSAHAHFEISKLIRMSVYAQDCQICENHCTCTSIWC